MKTGTRRDVVQMETHEKPAAGPRILQAHHLLPIIPILFCVPSGFPPTLFIPSSRSLSTTSPTIRPIFFDFSFVIVFLFKQIPFSLSPPTPFCAIIFSFLHQFPLFNFSSPSLTPSLPSSLSLSLFLPSPFSSMDVRCCVRCSV